MHARVTTIEAQTDKIDAVLEQVRGETVPLLERQDGFKGFTMLADRSGGRILGVSFWESEDAMAASEEAVTPSRDQAAETSGAPEPSVERYEVLIDTMA